MGRLSVLVALATAASAARLPGVAPINFVDPVLDCGIRALAFNFSTTLLPDAEFDALVQRPAFSCGVGGLYNASGWSDFYYPTLVDSDSPSDNFDEVGGTAELFLVGNRCVNAAGDGAGGVQCSPFDVNGLLVRDVLRAGVRFAA